MDQRLHVVIPDKNSGLYFLEPEQYAYDSLPSSHPIDWGQTNRGNSPWDNIDFHVDLGCGTVPKARIGIDRHDAEGVNIVMDLDDPEISLPFRTSSIKSIISHHFFEHIGEGFIPLVDEIYRVLQPGGILRAITPLFPSTAAVEDPDHCRYFMENTWDTFGGWPDVPHWHESFSVPYTKARFVIKDKDMTPRVGIDKWWSDEDAREIRVALEAQK